MLKESSIQGWVLGSLGILALSLTLNGCSPERRAILRLTALNFQTQATEAIAATKVIYQLTANARPENQRREVLVRRLLTDPNLDFGNPEAINKIIGQILGISPAIPNPVNEALDDLRQEYVVAAETFTNLEQAGLLGTESKAVASAAEPARRLTVKMLLLAEMIRQNPPSPKNANRVWIFYQFAQLRTRYASATTDAERRQIIETANQLLDQLFTINAQETTIVCQATAKLLLTAQTGTQLSALIEDYDRLSLNEIVAKITTALGIASSLSGRDLTSVNSKITEIQTSIQKDAALNRILNELPQQRWQVSSSASAPLNCSQ
ncbi:hypothetical protein MTo_00112 [Microcystis aeruginosa NIES-1211]|jgi:hypothetical protein|uniref:hypothetical protein n=1 Tax=Microcystis TaxID=1125 RepID=UPI0002621448|nr:MULTISPECIES: hypothetical protein [Microcystis]GBL12825.1 hypothetical protein MTo_00112 [Microcystis aeruginosa NIES-1211]GCA89998.1 hypothetical protein MiTa_03353 [Microcystis aeruginosa NIES-4264]CCI32971.1 conserved exported hypothetical protein [Microcystis sp. T1-4]